jgi:hypothetical protein
MAFMRHTDAFVSSQGIDMTGSIGSELALKRFQSSGNPHRCDTIPTRDDTDSVSEAIEGTNEKRRN